MALVRPALLLTFALSLFGCRDATSIADAKALATVAPERPAPCDPPPPSLTQETLHPQFVVSKPLGWNVGEPLIDTNMLLTKAKGDAVIIMDNAVAAKGTPAEECQAWIRYFGVDRRSRFSRITVHADGSASFNVVARTDRGTRYGTVTVKHYGKDGHISVTYKGYWSRKSKKSASPDYKAFVNDVTLVKE